MKTFLSWIKIIIPTILIVFVIRYFIFTPIVVNGVSMMPTLHNENRMIGNKMGYKINGVDRFDIIVFRANKDEDYIKRVIGLPGDHIEYKNDQLYINGKKYDEPYLDTYQSQYSNGLLTPDFDINTLPATMNSIVPEGNYFVLGDNRQRSDDSRSIGFVAKEDVIGKANIVFWPLNEIRIVQ